MGKQTVYYYCRRENNGRIIQVSINISSFIKYWKGKFNSLLRCMLTMPSLSLCQYVSVYNIVTSLFCYRLLKPHLSEHSEVYWNAEISGRVFEQTVPLWIFVWAWYWERDKCRHCLSGTDKLWFSAIVERLLFCLNIEMLT